MAALNFNRSGYTGDTADSFSVIDPGIYLGTITKSEMKETKDKKGSYLSLTLKLNGNPKHDGRVLFCNLNLNNANPATVEIAEKNLSQICDALGVTNVTDSAQLHDRQLAFRVTIKKGTPQYPEDKNEVRSFMPAASAVNGGGAGAGAGNAASGGSEPSWMNKNN